MLDRRSFVLGAATGVGAMTVMSSKIVKAAAEQTMSLNVIYPNHDGARFDMRYYRDTHIPLAMKVMKADRVILIEVAETSIGKKRGAFMRVGYGLHLTITEGLGTGCMLRPLFRHP
jgi:hypothetical protein